MSYTATIRIEPPPARGDGLNTWMFKTACQLARRRVPIGEAADFIRDHAGQNTKPGEIERQVEQGYSRAFEGVARSLPTGEILPPSPRQPAWPTRNDDKLREVVEKCPASLSDIADASPIKPVDRHPVDVLAELHHAKGDELLCLAPSPTGGFQTRSFNGWANMISRLWRAAGDTVDEIAGWEMCVPNLMRLPTGKTLAGKRDRPRTKENACDPNSMRFVVVEVDIRADDPLCLSIGKTPLEICASVILSQLDREKIRMVVMSGGKSLHAWVDVAGKSAVSISEYFRTLAPLAVDVRGRLPEQQFRLPNGFRADKKARQSVLYWDPSE